MRETCAPDLAGEEGINGDLALMRTCNALFPFLKTSVPQARLPCSEEGRIPLLHECGQRSQRDPFGRRSQPNDRRYDMRSSLCLPWSRRSWGRFGSGLTRKPLSFTNRLSVIVSLDKFYRLSNCLLLRERLGSTRWRRYDQIS